jgi:RNA polymerase sigma-70 factor (ECF subfamily)
MQDRQKENFWKDKDFCKRNIIWSLYTCGCVLSTTSELCIAWVLQVRKVPKTSFKTLVDNYSAVVLNTAVRILRDTQKAQDVHQEVFLEIWRRWHKYNGRTNWPAYLYRVTVRKAIESAKRPAMEPLTEQQNCAAASERPDGPLRTAELQQRIVERLARLPQRQADVFVLTKIEGLKPEKIAQILGCSQETVRVHLHRALNRLAHEMSDYLDKA